MKQEIWTKEYLWLSKQSCFYIWSHIHQSCFLGHMFVFMDCSYSPTRSHAAGLRIDLMFPWPTLAPADGPYNLEVNSGQGLRTGEVFTINPGELVFFECQADSNPPNSYVWISKSRNATQVISEGPRLQVRFYRLAQAEEYLCRAFNNVTQKQNEAQFTLVVASLGTGG